MWNLFWGLYILAFPDTEEARQKPWLENLYPIGSHADVYYDPTKPKCAYVQRYIGPPTFLAFWFPMVMGILLAIAALAVLVIQPIA